MTKKVIAAAAWKREFPDENFKNIITLDIKLPLGNFKWNILLNKWEVLVKTKVKIVSES